LSDKRNNLYSEDKPKTEWRKELIEAFESYGLRPASADNYSKQLLSFCELTSTKRNKILPDTILDIPLEEIEDRFEEHARKFNNARAVNISGYILDDVRDVLLRRRFGNVVDPKKLKGYQIAPKRLNVQHAALSDGWSSTESSRAASSSDR